MAIKRKLTDPIWVALRDDEAMLDVPDNVMHKYLLSRDINNLDIDIEKGIYRPTQNQVSLFKVKPCSNTECVLVDQIGSGAYEKIFRANVLEMKNVLDIVVDPKPDGTTDVRDKDLETLGFDIISEVASVIYELGQGKNGVDKAFFLEATWLRPRARSRKLLELSAKSAQTESVNDTQTDTSSEA